MTGERWSVGQNDRTQNRNGPPLKSRLYHFQTFIIAHTYYNTHSLKRRDSMCMCVYAQSVRKCRMHRVSVLLG